jgi:hypothetical protein
MPFIKKNQSQDTQSSSSFIGRTGKILFFLHNILQPDALTHNILSISGQGGQILRHKKGANLHHKGLSFCLCGSL